MPSLLPWFAIPDQHVRCGLALIGLHTNGMRWMMAFVHFGNVHHHQDAALCPWKIVDVFKAL